MDRTLTDFAIAKQTGDASRYNHLQISGNKTCRGNPVGTMKKQPRKTDKSKRYKSVYIQTRFRKSVAVSIRNSFRVNAHFIVWRGLKRKAGVLNSSSLNSVFEKLRFCDGLVWIVLTVEIKRRFQISPAKC